MGDSCCEVAVTQIYLGRRLQDIMQQGSRVNNIVIGFVAVLLTLLVIDRFYWAQISQWREDQATNLWLGYTAGFGRMPVGLISSQNIPNPNGMILLGSLLSLLPGLLSTSFFLGCIQGVLLTLVGWKAFGRNWQYFVLTAAPVLSSVILRSISVEFWNQYTITLVNIFFLFWALRYLENQSLWNLPPITILILLAPSLYLAGAANAIVMTIITLGILVYKKPNVRDFWLVAIVIALIVIVSIFLTWMPYFQNVSLEQLRNYNKHSLGPVAAFKTLWESFFGIPVYSTFQWGDQSIFALAFKHADEQILTYWTKLLVRLVARAYLLQAVFAFAAFAYAVFYTLLKGVSKTNTNTIWNRPALRLVILSMLFIILSFAISIWLGGPDWLHGERPDQIVQFLPMFLFFIFLLPLLLPIEGRAGAIIAGISYFSLGIFTIVNLLCGFMIIRDHLRYRGNALSEADVPLIYKAQAVDFIANDWKKHSDSNIVPVDYDLGGQRWDWVPEFGRKLTKWYPAAMTLGRGFDYELVRRYGLKNQQEGTQLRTFGNGRYLVTYAFEDPPSIEDCTHYVFGRLRVSVVNR